MERWLAFLPSIFAIKKLDLSLLGRQIPWADSQLNRSECHLAGGIEEFGFFGVAGLLTVDCALVAIGS